VLAGSPGSLIDALKSRGGAAHLGDSAANGEFGGHSPPYSWHPAALYWLGLAGIQSADEGAIRDGLLALLTLPAAYRSQHPELAAAGLYHAATALDKLKDDQGAAAVRSELTGQFGATYYGAKARTPVGERRVIRAVPAVPASAAPATAP
jgi:hypothetical protein